MPAAPSLLSTRAIPPRERLIAALDVPDADDARRLVRTLGDAVHFYKLGFELLMSGDYFELVDELAGAGQEALPRSQALRHPRDRRPRGAIAARAAGDLRDRPLRPPGARSGVPRARRDRDPRRHRDDQHRRGRPARPGLPAPAPSRPTSSCRALEERLRPRLRGRDRVGTRGAADPRRGRPEARDRDARNPPRAGPTTTSAAS